MQAVLDFADNFSRDASPDDLFIEILLRSKLRLDTTYALENLASGGTVYVTDHNELVAYVDSSNITIEQAKEILAKSPKKFVVIDAAFNGQDDLKINIANMCKESGISEFKTI